MYARSHIHTCSCCWTHTHIHALTWVPTCTVVHTYYTCIRTSACKMYTRIHAYINRMRTYTVQQCTCIHSYIHTNVHTCRSIVGHVYYYRANAECLEVGTDTWELQRMIANHFNWMDRRSCGIYEDYDWSIVTSGLYSSGGDQAQNMAAIDVLPFIKLIEATELEQSPTCSARFCRSNAVANGLSVCLLFNEITIIRLASRARNNPVPVVRSAETKSYGIRSMLAWFYGIKWNPTSYSGSTGWLEREIIQSTLVNKMVRCARL